MLETKHIILIVLEKENENSKIKRRCNVNKFTIN